MKNIATDIPRADELEKAAWLHQKMADDLRAQAAQLRYDVAHPRPKQAALADGEYRLA